MQTTEVPQVQVSVRPMVEADRPFVFATWLNHGVSSSSFGRAVGRDAYMRSVHRVIERLLDSPDTHVLVATPVGSDDILGFLACGAWNASATWPAVHFAFVKKFARGHGVFRALLAAGGIEPNECVWTFPTDAAQWVKPKWPGAEVLSLFS